MQATTSYEIALTVNGKRYFLGYTERHTKGAIARAMVANRVRILELIDDSDAEWNSKAKAFIGPTWQVGFTGRTKRDANTDGELPR